MIFCSILSKLNKQKRRLLVHFYHFCYSQKQRDFNIKFLTLFFFCFIFHFYFLRYYRNLDLFIYVNWKWFYSQKSRTKMYKNWIICLNIIVIDLVHLHNTKRKYITKYYIKRKINCSQECWYLNFIVLTLNI